MRESKNTRTQCSQLLRNAKSYVWLAEWAKSIGNRDKMPVHRANAEKKLKRAESVLRDLNQTFGEFIAERQINQQMTHLEKSIEYLHTKINQLKL